MKILAIIEFKPKTGIIRRKRFREALRTKDFVQLPDSPCGWVSDHRYSAVEQASEALAEASATSGAKIHKAYVIEYGSFVVLPRVTRRT